MFKKRIPTIVGLLLLLIGAVSGVIFINQGTDFLPRAAPEYIPQKVKITNISDTGFVVSWVTEEPTVGFIRYSDNPLNLSTTATDDRDQLTGNSGNYRTHYVTLQNLNPGSTYYFKLGSQKNQLYDDNGQPFDQILPGSTATKPDADTVFGTVLTAVDTPAEGAIVYLALENATPLSALVKQNGNWAVNLSDSKALNFIDYAVYDPQTSRIDILIQADSGEPTTAITTTANDQPVPKIILGQDNIFLNQVPDSTPESSPTSTHSNPSPNKFPLDPIAITQDDQLTITSIPKDGVISNPTPELSGQAPPHTSLTIIVNSPVSLTGQITADDSGRWQWLVPSALDEGEHTVTISYTDSNGQVHSSQQSFIVSSASLQQVDIAYSATPSAAAMPTPQPTAIAKPTTSPLPTATPSPTPRAIVASGSADIIAGNTSASITTIIFGVSLAMIGLVIKKLFPAR